MTAMHKKINELPHGTYVSYGLGFGISLFLTAFVFWYAPSFGVYTYAVFMLVALAQLAAQLFFFLHLGRGTDARTNVLLLSFTFIILLILVVGTLWIMDNLAHLHMPLPTTTDLYSNGEVAPQNELK